LRRMTDTYFIHCYTYFLNNNNCFKAMQENIGKQWVEKGNC